MKNVKLLLLVLISLLITSCSSDDDLPQKKDLLVGKWNITPVIIENEDAVSNPIHFVWNTSNNGTTLDAYQILKITQLTTKLDYNPLDLLRSCVFTADGNILVNYYSLLRDSLESIDSDYLTFKPVESTTNGDFRMLVFFNLNKVKDYFPNYILMLFPDLKTIITRGIPINYRFEGDHCVIYLDKEFISELVDLIVKYRDFICEFASRNGESYLYIAKMIIEKLPEELKDTKNLEIGLNLTK